MNIEPIKDKDSNFDLVFLHSDSENIQKTPHCKLHHAMLKVSTFKDKKGGYWRCCTTEQIICRAGCIETE